jgi:hypothetical protein
VPPPTWTVGEVLAAADVNSWFVPLVAIKGSDQSVTSSTVLVGDLALFLPLAANCSYEIRAGINYEGGTQGSSDFQWSFSPPGGSNFHYQGRYLDTGGNPQLPYLTGTSTNHAGTNGGGNIRTFGVSGLIQVSSTAANLSFNFSQNTSNGTATTVHAGSWMIAQRVS